MFAAFVLRASLALTRGERLVITQRILFAHEQAQARERRTLGELRRCQSDLAATLADLKAVLANLPEGQALATATAAYWLDARGDIASIGLTWAHDFSPVPPRHAGNLDEFLDVPPGAPCNGQAEPLDEPEPATTEC
jgi:hypothetical protein